MKYTLTPLSQVANAEKTVPAEWIIDGKTMTNDIITYCEPLMKGEVMLRYGHDGLPVFSRLPRKFI